VEENAVNDLWVVKGDAGNLLRNREDNMEVFDRQPFSPPAFQPLGALRVLALTTSEDARLSLSEDKVCMVLRFRVRAVAVTAGVIRNPREVTLAAFFGMASDHKRRGMAQLIRG